MGGMGGTLLLSVRQHTCQSSGAPLVHQNFVQLKFVFFQIKSYNNITRLELNQPRENK